MLSDQIIKALVDSDINKAKFEGFKLIGAVSNNQPFGGGYGRSFKNWNKLPFRSSRFWLPVQVGMQGCHSD